MRVLKLAMWAMTWAAFGYLWRERVALRERLPAGQLAAVSAPPLALPPPEVIDLPALALPRPEVPKDIDATEKTVTTPAPSPAPAPIAKRVFRGSSAQRRLHGYTRTAGHVLAVVVTGAAVGAFAVWMLLGASGLL